MKKLAAVVSCAWALTAVIARADDVSAVRVEATRFTETADSLPASITVIRAEDIARSAARTLPELLAEHAGLYARDLFGNNAAQTTVDLRGYGITAPQNLLVLLDGQRLNDFDLSGIAWSAIPLGSIERIEILRGSGAVLYGGGASAGVVNLVSRSPLRRGTTFAAEGRVATYGTSDGQLRANYANDRFGLSAAAHRYASSGYRVNSRNEQDNGSLRLRWDLGASVVDLAVGLERSDVGLPGGRRIQASTGQDEYSADRRGARTPSDYASRDSTRAVLGWRSSFGDVEASAGLEYRDKLQHTFARLGAFTTFRADALDVASFTPRLRIPFSTGVLRHRLTAGVDLHDWRYRSRRSNLPDNVVTPINRVTVTQDVTAIYLSDAIDLSPRTQAMVGWRDERARYEGQDALDRTAPGFAFNTAAPRTSETLRARAWELGLRHAFDARWSAYLRASRSFRLVNAEEIYEFDALGNQQFQILRPQFARTHEAGLNWRAPTLTARAALFRTDVRDEIHLDPFSTGVGNTNLPPSRREGIEFDGQWQASSTLRLGGALTYTSARFRSGILPGSAFAIATNLDISGRRVPLVPTRKLNLSLDWQPWPNTRLSAALAAVTEQVMDNDEPNTLPARIPAYQVVDLKLSRAFGWGRVALAVNNLLDERYYAYAVRSAFTVDRYDVYPLPGRTYGVTLEMKLD